MRAFLLPLAFATTLGLAACAGFQPLYATPGVQPAFAGIAVATPDGRTGHLLREQLNDELGAGRDGPVRYRLELAYDETRFPRGLRVDNTADRYELSLQVDYTLVDAATGQTVTNGRVAPSVVFDSADQPYAGVQAGQDASLRAAGQAARLIRLDLMRYFAQQSAAGTLPTGG